MVGLSKLTLSGGKINQTSLLLKLSANSSTKDKIIQILSEEWPLTSKEIFNRLIRQYSIQISYQGVHKLISELSGQNMLQKDGSKYSLSKEWVDSNKAFFESIQKRYSDSNGKFKINPGFEGTITLEFTNFSRLCLWLAELLASKSILSGEDRTLIGYMRYGYWTLTFNFTDLLVLLKLLGKVTTAYPIIKNKTPFGEWIMKQYMKAGAVKGTFDKNLELDHDIFIEGDCIIEIYTAPEFDQYMDKTFAKIKDINGLFQNFSTNKEPDSKLNVVITKNPQMAKFLKNEALKKYGVDGK